MGVQTFTVGAKCPALNERVVCVIIFACFYCVGSRDARPQDLIRLFFLFGKKNPMVIVIGAFNFGTKAEEQKKKSKKKGLEIKGRHDEMS